MIKAEYRFSVVSGELDCGGPWTWHVVDFDQRRWISVTGTEKGLPEGEDAIRVLARHADQLSPDVYKIYVSDDGDLLSVSSNPNDDHSYAVQYPRFDPSLETAANSEVVLTRSQLTEVDRLGPEVDLVRCNDDSGENVSLVFKYSITFQNLERIWKEAHIMKSLSGHDLVVPFHRLIIDDIEPRILGFTSHFIPGGTFAENRSRTFRFSWLQQLTSIVDELNFKFGIMHQDIAPRNLVVDPITEKIRLFDFNYSAKIGGKGHHRMFPNDTDGVIYTIYEILTLDDQFRNMSWEKQDVRMVQDIVDWDVKIPIEEGCGGVTGIRMFLNGWFQARKAAPLKLYCELASPLDVPEYPPTTPTPWLSYPLSDKSDQKPIQKHGGTITRRNARKNGRNIIFWERPMTKPSVADRKRKLTSSAEDLSDKQSGAKRAKSAEPYRLADRKRELSPNVENLSDHESEVKRPKSVEPYRPAEKEKEVITKRRGSV